MAIGEGIDVRQAGSDLLFVVQLLDSSGVVVTSGTTSLAIYEVQDDGTLDAYDFNDGEFESGAVTTETVAMTHQATNNGTTNTGIWTYVLNPAQAFSSGKMYIYRVTNASAATPQSRIFQYGGRTRINLFNKKDFTVATGACVVFDEDGDTQLGTITPAESSGVVTLNFS